jgi:hypothetical protein
MREREPRSRERCLIFAGRVTVVRVPERESEQPRDGRCPLSPIARYAEGAAKRQVKVTCPLGVAMM